MKLEMVKYDFTENSISYAGNVSLHSNFTSSRLKK